MIVKKQFAGNKWSVSMLTRRITSNPIKGNKVICMQHNWHKCTHTHMHTAHLPSNCTEKAEENEKGNNNNSNSGSNNIKLH